jgi:uncharacterized protein (DUF924 family)
VVDIIRNQKKGYQTAMNEGIEKILAYWFGTDDSDVIKGRDAFWFSADEKVDGEINDQFSTLIDSAKAGRLGAWEASAKGSLALIILLDQFTRNIHRGSDEAFMYDQQARAICRRGIQQGLDQQLSISERVFYYLPLEHSELIADQKECVQLYRRLAHNVDEKYADQYKEQFTFYVEYAVLHYEIIAAYGRFPHRNAIVGRESTSAELKYLKEGGFTFGQEKK